MSEPLDDDEDDELFPDDFCSFTFFSGDNLVGESDNVMHNGDLDRVRDIAVEIGGGGGASPCASICGNGGMNKSFTGTFSTGVSVIHSK